jgi:hypothetical protein
MSEANLWAKIRERMAHKWDEATRHEDKLNPGICDVSFVAGGRHGWVELKKIQWPKRAGTIVRCKHYTPEQRNFLKRKGRAGGNTWLFVQIGRDHLLFDWERAQQFGELNTEETLALANHVWRSRMDWDEFAEILKNGN